jgi:hypothetical protein
MSFFRSLSAFLFKRFDRWKVNFSKRVDLDQKMGLQ